ncbi:Dcp1-like decapping family [Cryptosporidium sp. chipmunk genotype I]|uniref:Dcp1-like decapping family n=1 Tax=Cryptosporidium sp. chipmunk genotype I TaxID=1280935 RepID=UPI00351A8C90|nr:Dcp1-like decapping family [Cryptosporidium sp. chipmunk genotype I]
MNSLENQRKSNLEDERRKLNLQLLKRHDENINEIIAYSSFVSVYLMDASTQKWVRGEVEGFLHIVKRDIEPIYQLIVLNQKNPDNLILGITSEWELSGETNYLFYKSRNKNNNSTVSCLWFYEVEERKSIEASLKQIISKLMVKRLNSDIDNNSSSSHGFQSDPTSIYNNNAGKTILEFLNKKSNQKNQEGEVNIEQMIRNSVNNNKVIQANRNLIDDDHIKNNVEKNNDFNNVNSPGRKNTNSVERSSSEKTVINDSLQKLLHFQDILGKGSKAECNYNQKNENITPEAITDIIMDVLSSRQVYNMINERIEILLRK